MRLEMSPEEKSTRAEFGKTGKGKRKKSIKNSKRWCERNIRTQGRTYVCPGRLGLRTRRLPLGGICWTVPQNRRSRWRAIWETGTCVDRSEFSGTAETVPVGRSGNNPCCTSCADRLARHHHPVTGDGHSGRSMAVPSAAQTQLPAAVPGSCPVIASSQSRTACGFPRPARRQWGSPHSRPAVSCRADRRIQCRRDFGSVFVRGRGARPFTRRVPVTSAAVRTSSVCRRFAAGRPPDDRNSGDCGLKFAKRRPLQRKTTRWPLP